MSETRTVTVNGVEMHIPPEIAEQTKFTKTGAVDKRADHSAFDAWLAEQEIRANAVEDGAIRASTAVAELREFCARVNEALMPNPEPPKYDEAQALADRIWDGQANDLKLEVRRARILAALEERNLPTDQIDWPDERKEPAKPGEPPREPDRIQSEQEQVVAQAYALKVWHGQEFSLGRSERVARVRRALEGQGLSMHGVELPRN